MQTKTATQLAGSAILAVVLASNPVAAEPEVKELALGFGLDLPFAPHIVAIEKGWFADAGFTDVSTKTFTAGALAGEALVAGEIHLWTPGNLPPISMVHNGIPVVILGTNSVNTDLEKLVVRNDANVNEPEDLYNIRIGLLQGSTSGAMLGGIIEHYGLDASRIQSVNLAPPEALASMASNETQALLIWEPWPFRALSEIDSKVVHSGRTSFFESNKGETVQVSNNRSMFVASQEFVRDNPNTVQAMMEVLVRAQEYVADPANRTEVIQLFSEFQDQPVEMNDALFDNNYVFDPTFDDAYIADMEAISAFLASSGRIKDPMEVLDYTYTEPVASIDQSLVQVKGRWAP